VARIDLKTLVILHVEDDDNDAVLLFKACERARLPAELHRVPDGEHAKAYLLGEGDYADRLKYPVPQIVILDLKLPRMDGFGFLKWLRAEKAFASLPVLVFTASMSREDKARAMTEGANSYFIKPASFETLVQMVQFFRGPESGHLN
jgi:DNA-binding response OmpR family regulator